MSETSAAAPEGESLYTLFDHCEPPLGPDGTPNAFYAAVRDEAVDGQRPVGWSEMHGGFWMVAGHPEAMEVLHNTVDFSNEAVTFPRYGTSEPLMMAGQDEPEHRRARNLVNAPFAPSRVTMYIPTLRTALDELIDGFITQGHTNIGKTIAEPIPAILTALIMGLPAKDGPLFFDWAWALSHEFHSDPQAAAPKIAAMYRYFEAVIEDRRRNPGDDILSSVVHAEIDGERLSMRELLSFCVVLLLGGIDNTSKLIGTTLWRLGWDIELRNRIKADPALVPATIDEMLRFYSPATEGRTVVNPVSVAGVEMTPGQIIMLMAPIANRDSRVFPYPDTFIADRSPNKHLALSAGIHRCLGAHLLRMEAQVVINGFLARIPEYELDRTRPAKWTTGQLGGMTTVPIAFVPGARRSGRTDNVQVWLDRAA
jgi:cytochrome P450